jgi:hypothetical protein
LPDGEPASAHAGEGNVKRFLSVVALVLFATTAACGGGDNGAAPAAGSPDRSPSVSGATSPAASATGQPSTATGSTGAVPSACDLLSPQQVQSAMGEAGVAQRPESQGPTSLCTWDGANTGRRYITVIARPAQFAASVLENSFKNAAGSQSLDLGDEAYALPGVNTPDYRYLSAAAIAGDLYLQVNIAGPERTDAEALEAVTSTLAAAMEAAR